MSDVAAGPPGAEAADPAPGTAPGTAAGATPGTEPAGTDPAGTDVACLDVGGSGIKGSVVSADGALQVAPVRVKTTYPLSPDACVAALVALLGRLPAAPRVAVGFPGMVRGGLVLTAPHFVTVAGPGTAVDPALARAWDRFPLAAALERAAHRPVRLGNDADVQGLAAISGRGLELVLTLGTGYGSAVFLHGQPAPHLELAHHPLRGRDTYNDYVGDAARRATSSARWQRRCARAVATTTALVAADTVYVGGGNAVRLGKQFRRRYARLTGGGAVTVVPNTDGITGGAKLWAVRDPV